MKEITFIVIGWIFLNVVIKLFVNSIERIFKDKIDNLVIESPNYFKFVGIEIIRFILIIIASPTIIIFNIIPFVKRIRSIRYTLSDLKIIYSAERFHKRVPFMAFMLKHPLSLILMKRQDQVIHEWLNRNGTTIE